MNRFGAILVLCAVGVSSAQAAVSARLTGAPLSGQSLRAGEATTLQFQVDEEAEIEEMEVLLSVDGGGTFPLRVTREMSGGTHERTWFVPNLPTVRARLALRVGDEENGEVIRDVSPEFVILPAETEPLERVRLFRDEWRTGEALEEIPSAARPPLPLEGPGLDSAAAIRALRHDTDFGSTPEAAPTGAPPDSEPKSFRPVSRDRTCPLTSRRAPRNTPRRE